MGGMTPLTNYESCMSYANQPALFYEHPFTVVYPTQIHMTWGKLMQ